MSADLWSTCALCTGDAAMATLQWRAEEAAEAAAAATEAAAAAAAAAPTAAAASATAAVLRLHSTFVHSGNDSRHLMSSNVHREYTGCAQVVLHQQGATEAATKG